MRGLDLLLYCALAYSSNHQTMVFRLHQSLCRDVHTLIYDRASKSLDAGVVCACVNIEAATSRGGFREDMVHGCLQALGYPPPLVCGV